MRFSVALANRAIFELICVKCTIAPASGSVNLSNKDNASTFAKGLEVLNCFEDGRNDLTMADIARITGFDRATSRRLCLTLEATGYLYRRDKFLRLTPKAVAIAGGYMAAQNIGRSFQPILNQYAEELNSEISIAVRDGTRAIYVARSEVSTARRSLGFSVGSTLPLLPTSVGRMLLARCTPELRDEIVEQCPLAQYTEATNMNRVSILEKIKQASVDGYAHVANEFEPGAGGIAVPIPDIGGAQAVVATTDTLNQFSKDGEVNRVLDILRRAALGFRG